MMHLLGGHGGCRFSEEVGHGAIHFSNLARLVLGAPCYRCAGRDRTFGLQQKITESISSNLGAPHRVFLPEGIWRSVFLGVSGPLRRRVSPYGRRDRHVVGEFRKRSELRSWKESEKPPRFKAKAC